MNTITILEGDGLRSLHFGTPAVQGVMRVERPDEIVLTYVQQMMMWLLFRNDPTRIVQLGLGAAALTKFCYHRFPGTKVTAVELSRDVISTCRQHFSLPPDDARLNVLHMDALEYVSDFSRRRSVDILQVDLYDAQAHAPALSSEAFYAACANCLSRDGMMTINLYCDWPDHAHHIRMIEQSFESVAWLPEVHDGNIVAIAFRQSPAVDFDVLKQRAAQIQQATGLPADTWVEGLLAWMLGELDMP